MYIRSKTFIVYSG